MKKNESQKPISLEELLKGLRENKQNEELAEMLDRVLGMSESGE